MPIEYAALLKDQVNYLKQDITQKNIIIESLLSQLAVKQGNTSSTNKASSIISSKENYVMQTEGNKVPLKEVPFNTEYAKWQFVGDAKISRPTRHSYNNNKRTNQDKFISPNRYSGLSIDDDADFDNECDDDIKFRNGKINCYENRQKKPKQHHQNIYTNKRPENDNINYGNKRVVPGNATYANITRSDSSICILSDSICKRIRMRNFNDAINDGHAYMKAFPGATPKELQHYCTHTLSNVNPDIVIINIGTNQLGKCDALEICNDITEVVNVAHNYGVSKVYVSSIAFRPDFVHQVNEVNTLLRANQALHNYELINNDNIKSMHIWKDKIHLNDGGIGILSNNFLCVLNRRHIS